MRERLLEFLQSENKSSAQFAEEIGVQASGISHILSGRNNPSLDFVLKMLEKYKFLSTDWLLFGKGTMYKEPKMPNLFDFEPVNSRNSNEVRAGNEQIRQETEIKGSTESKAIGDSMVHLEKSGTVVIKIVWFFANNSFKEFFPI